MDFDFDTFDRVEKDFDSLFHLLSITQKEIQEKLEAHSDGKVLKGNELVGWLGEIYTKIVVNGRLVDDSYEHDVETNNGLKISVKTRKGENNGWTRTSAIPKIESAECPTHLMFVHLKDSYIVSEMWFYPWSKLIINDRFRKHIVRGNFRSFYMSVSPKLDEKYKIYPCHIECDAKEKVQNSKKTIEHTPIVLIPEFTKLSRIKLWANRPHQINSRIIRAYLKFEKIGPVLLAQLREYCIEELSIERFDSHFASMKTDNGNSHGSVFYEQGRFVKIWDKVKQEIDVHFTQT